MVILHEPKLIFLKAGKVGGSSLEIALSFFAGPEDVITPIDEDWFRKKTAGFRSAQNFRELGAYNHMTPSEVRERFQHFSEYETVAVIRCPWDTAVSTYFWQKKLGLTDASFGDFVRYEPQAILMNDSIYQLDGEYSLSHYVRYERYTADLISLEEAHPKLKGLADLMKKINAKGDVRPRSTKNTSVVYSDFPDAIGRIADLRRGFIDRFGYAPPDCS
ncbi:hypothetical protein OAO91_03285 [Luminiphilus sp.]|nr:hypothetical protein [Luminiphilus sp.]